MFKEGGEGAKAKFAHSNFRALFRTTSANFRYHFWIIDNTFRVTKFSQSVSGDFL